ncbi:outer membrane receptor protein involved in Fe transport [Arcicella aurantiaca]|uniref:Outer membrane receptor protein involved in Fe transport n=1 Tax=Arcicella aurantiaca TaxID=591202 RepID=A0A316DUJ8_9BACT|nr:TonB-dependent receptor [Arcicella aurantiaca]PWK21635.1 outer membrane receptor protein involved in Fe transport [Arcicella aurantiaca]
MKKFLIIIILFVTSITSFAQKNISLSGRILDKQQPVEFANVTLSKMIDTTKVLYFAVTDSLGKYHFQLPEQGDFLMKISLIGYLSQSKKINSSVVNLTDIQLFTDTKLLNEVVVTTQKKLIEKTNEGFVVNAAANIAQIGGTATDLLKSTPTIAVDADGAITLRGKTPLILINGRNSKLANADQIPASSIESIEVINNASAKYDANAQSGIINIKLKKNNQSGTNGAIVVGAGFGARGRASSSLILNHKTEKWNIGLGYDNRFAGRIKNITSQRTNFNLPDTYLINQNRKDERMERLQNLKLNLDFSPNEKNSFAFEAIGNFKAQDNDEDLVSIIQKSNNGFVSGNDRHSWEYQKAKVGEFALNYTRKFDNPQKTFSANITTSLEKSNENTDIVTQNLAESLALAGSPFLQRTHNNEDSNISNIIIDYGVPLTTNGILETGYKATFRNITTDYEAADKKDNVYVINTATTNIFKFNEQIHAFYALFHSYIGNSEAGKLKYELGLRMENVNNNGETTNKSTQFSNQYLKFFPTANISYAINASEFWKLSYAKRINRPELDELNPFVDITDVLNPHSGNPFLKPEIIQALEMGYNKEWDNTTLSTNLFYRHSENTIRAYLQSMGNGVVLRLPVNIGTANSYGLENIFTTKIGQFYDLNASLTLFQQELNGSNIATDVVQSSFNWFGKLINNFNVSKRGKLQIIGNYNSAQTTPQGRLIPLYNVDLGFQQKLGKGNARLGLVLVDVFNTLQSGTNVYSTDFNSVRNQKADTRAIMITYAYSFKSLLKDKLMENKFSKEF